MALLVEVKYSKYSFAAKSAQSEIGVGFADRRVGFIRQNLRGRVCRGVTRWRANGLGQDVVGATNARLGERPSGAGSDAAVDLEPKHGKRYLRIGLNGSYGRSFGHRLTSVEAARTIEPRHRRPGAITICSAGMFND